MSDNEKDQKWPAPYNPTMPQRTPTGQFPKGVSGNPKGRPLSAKAQFSRELREAYRDHFAANGADAIEKVFREKPEVYLALAVKLVPQEVHVQENRAMEQMTDEELIAIVVAARGMQKTDAD
jgi:Family of unknown function (DUF5681)